MQMQISEIVVRKRVRQDLGDLKDLMESLKKFGQLNPVIITREKELIAGHRRLESAKRLGWYTVDVVSVDRVSEAEKLEMELQENVHRKDLSPAELLEGYSRLEKLLKPSFLQRVKRFFRGLFGKLFARGKQKDARIRDTDHAGKGFEGIAQTVLPGEQGPVYAGDAPDDQYGV